MEPHIGAKFQKIPALGYGDTQDRPDGRTDGRTGLNFKVQSLVRRGTKKKVSQCDKPISWSTDNTNVTFAVKILNYLRKFIINIMLNIKMIY